jgi:FkbM family methyltransferase
VITAPTWNGVLSFSSGDHHNARVLYVQRAWERDLIEGSLAFLRAEGLIGSADADLVIDAGANIGMISIAMVLHGDFRGALAFEPDPENFELLTRNIRQNGMEGAIRAFQVALSDSPGDVELEMDPANFGDHRVRSAAAAGVPRMGEERRTVVRVPARTLDSMLEGDARADSARVGLVWLDIQGHEGQFFEGARRTLSRRIPVVAEFWPYGILRAGLDRDRYFEIVRSLFSRIAIIDPVMGRAERYPIGEIPKLFDANPSPGQALTVIFYSK